MFGRLPQSPYGVKVVPEAAAPSQTTAYYEPGAFRIGRPGAAGYMFANTYKLEMRPKWEMEALTLHEAVPGHHLQISIAQELEGIPEFRKNTSYTAYVEGWALYAESLGEEMGFYRGPLLEVRPADLRDVARRAPRGRYRTALDELDAPAGNRLLHGQRRQDRTGHHRRGRPLTSRGPGQALGYKLGQMKIQELRAASAKQLGERFDCADSTTLVLSEGAVPLDVLESRLKAWAAH